MDTFDKTAVKNDVEREISALKKTVEMAKHAVSKNHMTSSFGSWLESKVTTVDPTNIMKVLDKMDKDGHEPWRRKGRALANGALWKEANPQAAIDQWTKTGRDLQQAAADFVGIQAETTVGHIVVGTVAKTTKDVQAAAVAVANWSKPILLLIVVLAALWMLRKVI